MDTNLPVRPKEGHKGTFGTVAVFAGHVSDESVMLGSAVFAAEAAIKSGAGLIDFFADKQTLVELIKMFPQAVGHTFKSFDEQSAKWDAVIVGPGWQAGNENVEMLERILQLGKAVVIDGEALNILSRQPDLMSKLHNKCVLTPHPKEFERLSTASGISDPAQFAKKYTCVLVLKGSTTRIFGYEEYWEFKGDNPALATGGTGDVLTGLIAGFAAQYFPGISLFDCAKNAIEIHAQAAEKFRQAKGDRGLIIDELIDNIAI